MPAPRWPSSSACRSDGDRLHRRLHGGDQPGGLFVRLAAEAGRSHPPVRAGAPFQHRALAAAARSGRGIELDMVPVTEDGRIDLDALPRPADAASTRLDLAGPRLQRHRRAARCARGRRRLAKPVGAKVMLDGAQRAPHGPLDLPALGHRFLCLRRPQGLRTQRHRRAVGPSPSCWRPCRRSMGGGSMIGRVTLAETTWAPPPRRFEAGTPPIGPAIGLGAACTWMRALDWTAAHDHEMALVQRLMDGLQKIDGTQIVRPGQPAEPLSGGVVHARRRASARRGADAGFVRRRGARRPSLRPAADGPLRPRRHHARVDGALQRQHRHRRPADGRRSTPRKTLR